MDPAKEDQMDKCKVYQGCKEDKSKVSRITTMEAKTIIMVDHSNNKWEILDKETKHKATSKYM